MKQAKRYFSQALLIGSLSLSSHEQPKDCSNINTEVGDAVALMQSHNDAYESPAVTILLDVSTQCRESSDLQTLGAVVRANYWLAFAYKNGRGVEKDLPKALAHCRETIRDNIDPIISRDAETLLEEIERDIVALHAEDIMSESFER